jgi:hypothetical protein
MLSAVPPLLIFTIATFPGEWLDATLPSFRLVPTQWPADEPKDNEEAQNDNGNEPALEGEGNKPETFWQKVNNRVKSKRWTTPHDLLVGGMLISSSANPQAYGPIGSFCPGSM